MRRKMLYALLILVLGVLGIVAALAYPIVKIKTSASVIHPETRFIPASNEQALYGHVHALSVVIGSRSIWEYKKLQEAERYIRAFLEREGIPFSLQGYDHEGNRYNNIVVTLNGESRRDESVVIGSHYDTVYGTPGADDNASAVAVLLELCRTLKDYRPDRTLKMIFFVLEEPPAFRTPAMGSHVYAMQARDRGENIVGMISLEMVGYFNEAEGTQGFPGADARRGRVPEGGLCNSCRAFRGAALHPGHRLVRSRLLLGNGFPGRHGDRHGLLPEPELSQPRGHDRDTAVR
jgi:hypothetical protein